jgi:hypothetical protein
LTDGFLIKSFYLDELEQKVVEILKKEFFLIFIGLGPLRIARHSSQSMALGKKERRTNAIGRTRRMDFAKIQKMEKIWRLTHYSPHSFAGDSWRR